MIASIHIADFGPYVRVSGAGIGNMDFAIFDARQIATPKRIAYTMQRALEYVASRHAA